MAAAEVVRARIESGLKKEVTAVLSDMGLSVSDAIRLLFVRVAADKALPFDLRVPNAETRAAIAEIEQGKAVRFGSIAALMADLNDDTGAAEDRTFGKNEEIVPVVEETLRVGKREVERGGVRVRSYIVETPVNEQVTLHEGQVSVERRRVTDGFVPGDAFRDRTIEMTETVEEAVVAKEARIVEEVVVRKTAGDRTETISDTVRRTEVEVDDGRVEKFASGAGFRATAADRGVGLGNKITDIAKEGAGKPAVTDLERRGKI